MTTDFAKPTPDPALAALEAGKAALDIGDLPAALRHFEEVAGSAPGSAESWGNLAALYASLGDAERAEACYGKVLAALPGHPDAHYNRGLVRMRLERFDAAGDDFAAVVGQLPADADAHNNLGVACFMRGHLAGARAAFTRALACAPRHVNAVLNLCDAEVAAGCPEAALAACEAFLADGAEPAVERRRFDLLAERTRAALASGGLRAAAASG